MGFGEAIASGFRNYVTFSGRAQRSAYWWWALFVFLSNLALSFIDSALFGTVPETGQSVSILGAIFALATFLPSLAVGARRLHDIDRTAWWLLIGLVPIIGFIVLLVFFVQRGTEGPNRFGPDPLGGGGDGGLSRTTIPRTGG